MKLTDYITGNRKGREARRIEREAMDDPFLRDALEGYDSMPGDPTDAIRRMRRRVTGAAEKLRRRIYWSAAALLLCAGAGGYLLTLREPDGRQPIALQREPSELPISANRSADSVVLAAVATEKTRIKEKTFAPGGSGDERSEIPEADESTPAERDAELAEDKTSRPAGAVAGNPQPSPSDESLSQAETALPVAADIAA